MAALLVNVYNTVQKENSGLKYMFHADFVASNCRAELEFLRRFQQENRALLENLRNSVA